MMVSCGIALNGFQSLPESSISRYIESGKTRHALSLYEKLQGDCSHLNGRAFVPLLAACAKLHNLEMGSKLHAAIETKGLERDTFIGSSLVDMYAKCGVLEKAQDVFDKLQARNMFAWTALIVGYAKHGREEEALFHFDRMCLAGISSSLVAFSCCLKACGSLRATQKGQEIHAEIARRGLLGHDRVVGNALVDMYAKCGLLSKAQEVFGTLRYRNVVSWTGIIDAHVKHGQNEEAFSYFEQMQDVGISPDVVAFVCAVKACTNVRAADKGVELYVEIARRALLEDNLILGNALVDMFANCGLLAKAREVFDKLPIKDVISWTSLIGGYAEHGHGEEALDLLDQMQSHDITPNEVTYLCGLKACTIIGAVDDGQDIHDEIAKHGLLGKCLPLGNTLIDMYASCGLLVKAQEVFNELPRRDAVSWTALIAGYMKNGYGEEAMSFFKQMRCKNIQPDAVAYACAFTACGSVGAVHMGEKFYDEVWKNGLFKSNFVVGNTVVDMYAKCGMLSKAQEVFDKLPVRNAVAWNALLAGYVNHEHSEEALERLEQMKLEKVELDGTSYICGLKACGSLGAVEVGSDLHAEICETSLLGMELALVNALVDMYACCGLLAKAQEVFDALPNRDVVSWTSLISGYAQLGESNKVFSTLDKMREDSQMPNTVTYLCVLYVCSHVGLVDESIVCLHSMNEDHGSIPNLGHYTCVIDLLGRAGQLDKTVLIIEHMPFHPNLVVWHIVMSACRRWGCMELGRQAFEYAVVLGDSDASTYISISNLVVDANIMDDI